MAMIAWGKRRAAEEMHKHVVVRKQQRSRSERQLRELKRKKTNPGAGAVSKSNAYTVAEDQ